MMRAKKVKVDNMGKITERNKISKFDTGKIF